MHSVPKPTSSKPKYVPHPINHLLAALPLHHSPHGFLSSYTIPNFKLHFCFPLEPTQLRAIYSAPPEFLHTPPPAAPLFPAGPPRPPAAPASGALESPPLFPETSGDSRRAGPRGGHLLPPPSSPRRPGRPSGSRAAQSLPPSVLRNPSASPDQLPAAAPPLPDPPPSGVAANRVPPGGPGTRVPGAGGGRSVWRARLVLRGQEGGSTRSGTAHRWCSGPAPPPPPSPTGSECGGPAAAPPLARPPRKGGRPSGLSGAFVVGLR